MSQTATNATQTTNLYHLSDISTPVVKDDKNIYLFKVLDDVQYQVRFRSTIFSTGNVITWADGRSSFKARVDAGFIAEVKNLETGNITFPFEGESEMVSLVKDDEISVKLPTSKNGSFNFVVKATEEKKIKTIDDLKGLIVCGSKIDLVFKVGGYISEITKTHGFYLTLTEILGIE